MMRKYPDDFEIFWQAYPNRVCKKIAFMAWQKLKPDKELQDKILKAIDEQSNTKQWQKNNGEFIPYPSTWLNQERWEDEVKVALPVKKNQAQMEFERLLKEQRNG
jgi:hypothetical protein